MASLGSPTSPQAFSRPFLPRSASPCSLAEKLAGLLATQGKDGKPAITAEQRTYFDGLNDHLKTLLGHAAESEIITRADHLGSILSLGLRPQKMEVVLQ